MALAKGLGLGVLKPFGESGRYDAAVENGGPFWRVRGSKVKIPTLSGKERGFRMGHPEHLSSLARGPSTSLRGGFAPHRSKSKSQNLDGQECPSHTG
jgi:hypothetical protein